MASLDFVVDTFVGSDGSKYYGTLKNGVPSGLGTCIWPNHCHYDGEWRNGVMHGFGTYVWKNGQRYDGEWKDGRREGIGIKTYVDGSMYDGFWKSGKKHGLGVFRPAPEESNSRRNTNTHWQSAAGSAPGQQAEQQGTEASSTTDSLSLNRVSTRGIYHVESSQVLAEAEAEAEAAAEAAAAAAGAGASSAGGDRQTQVLEHQQQQQQTPGTYVSPFANATAGLDGKLSVSLPTTLDEGVQEQQRLPLQPGTPSQGADKTAGVAAVPIAVSVKAASSLAAVDADADAPSTSPTTLVRGAPATSSGEGAAAAAPRKLFVREYDMGQLLREYPLTAEEIKTIFGFLWPKNKVRRRVQRVLRRGPRMQKKLGEVVYKGHYSYSLMLELQLGIRYSLGKALRPRVGSGGSATSLLANSFAFGVLRPWWSVSAAIGNTSCVSGGHVKDGELRQRQFSEATAEEKLVALDFREKLTVFFPSSGSSTTPAHPSTDFMWKDYCPRVFRRMRAAAGIDEADYMLSLAGSQALRQLNSPGKSGSMFLLSEDERFLVKTMRKSEMSVLLNMLPGYAAHMEQYPNSLITRFFGLHKVTPLHGRSVRFVVMANIFVTDLQIHRRYDIKGSTDGRTVGPEARAKAADGDPTVIFKDLDVDMRIVLEQAAHEQLMSQLKADCQLLKSVGVMDYSLLLGVHYPQRNFTRMSLEPVQSVSLEGLPQSSPLPGIGGNTAPGSVVASTQGSFLFAEPFSSAAGEAAAGAAVSAGGAGTHARSTISDDEVQQPPQQLIRLVAQQQQQSAQLMAQLAQAQQQQQQQQQQGLLAEGSSTTVGAAETPVLQEPAASARSTHSSVEQVPYLQLGARRSTSEDVQLPPHSSSACAVQQPASSAGFGPVSAGGAFSSAAGAPALVSAGGSAASSHHGGYTAAVGNGLGGASVNAAGARNWELWSGAAQQEEVLSKVMERMQAMGFSEQRMKDVAELARLKILGGKLKKSAARKEPPSAVLQAMQQQRQEAEGLEGQATLGHGVSLMPPLSPTAAIAAGAAVVPAGLPPRQQAPLPMHLTSLRGAFTGLGVPFEEDEEVVETPMAMGLPDPKAPAAGTAAAGLLGSQQLGINMAALAVSTTAPVGGAGGAGGAAKASAGGGCLDHHRGPEEVVLCFGIIDILQDYSARKLLERTMKGVTHDKAAISVAPPKLYAKRFLEFVTSRMFMSEAEYKQQLQQAGVGGNTSHFGALFGVQQTQQQQANGVLQVPPWSLAPIITNGAGAPASMPSPGSAAAAAAAGAGPSPGLAGIGPVAASQQQAFQQQQQQQPPGDLCQLMAEDSLPIPPGQLGTEGSLVSAAGAAAAAAAGCMVLKERGPSASSPVLPDAASPLLDLLAAPSGMIHLTSGDGNRASADQVGGSLDEGSSTGDGAPQGFAGPAAEPVDGLLVPAVVVELQGVVHSASSSKAGSLDGQQQGYGHKMNGHGHVVVVNGEQQ